MTPIAAYPQPRSKTPARMENSPAKFVDPGTARVNIPRTSTSVARIGRPFAIPPSFGELAGTGAGLDHPGKEEEARRDESVVDRVQHRAVEA